jgi:protein required for attachment to host cells
MARLCPRSAFEEVDWHQLAEDRFAVEIAGTLNRLAQDNRFHYLILVAPPKVLSTLRTQLNKNTTGRVVAEVAKDVTVQPVAEIARTLSLQSGRRSNGIESCCYIGP